MMKMIKKILRDLSNKTDDERKRSDIILMIGLVLLTVPLIVTCCSNFEMDVKKSWIEGCTYIKNSNSIIVHAEDRTKEEMSESWETCLKHVMDERESY